MQSRSGRTRYKVKTIGRLKDRRTGEVLRSYKEKGKGGRKPLIGKKVGGVMKARSGKMAKGYSKGGARMMRAMGGKMAKGYSKGGARMMRAMGGKMAKGMAVGGAAKLGIKGLRAAASKLGYSIVPTDKLRRASSISKGRGLKNDPLLSARLEQFAKVSGVNVKKTPATKKASAALLARRKNTPIPMATRKKKPGYGQGFLTGAAYTGAATVGIPALSNRKKKKKMSAFETSFAKARKAGKKTFTYQGKKYTTKLKK